MVSREASNLEILFIMIMITCMYLISNLYDRGTILFYTNPKKYWLWRVQRIETGLQHEYNRLRKCKSLHDKIYRGNNIHGLISDMKEVRKEYQKYVDVEFIE
jgi:hypothetical protein